MIVKHSRETSKSAANTGLAKVAGHYSADSFVLRNRQLLVAAKRYKQINNEKDVSDFRLQHPPSSGSDFRFYLSYS